MTLQTTPEDTNIPSTPGLEADSGRREVATLGGGCFWCIETVFNDLKGVEKAVSGYAGGSSPNPTYKQVCSGTTGHAEVVQITFDPSVLSYREILEIFFSIHDPTTLDRQGADVGSQYRSVIFTHTPEQREIAEQVMREVGEQGIWGKPLVTELSPAPEFYPAEEYHQRYFEQNPNQPYCRAVIAPKVAKFRQKHMEKLKK
ncbi:MAG: peptide-methionine (S)-S-oxide reductase MsrA [Armatimonadetes bacterium]|nr:peptide-methionine (S)-S-oxide reductase MsrA [Armatimonadota bacterium]